MRPRIRTVKPEMRRDERYGRMSIPAREMFNGLITMADDEGRFRALTSAIVGDIFPFDDPSPTKIRAWVKEVQDSRMVLFYKVDGTPYGAFRNWARHQKINRPSPSELPPPPDPKVVRDNQLIRAGSGWKQGPNSVDAHGDVTDGSMALHEVITELSGSVPSPRVGARSDPDPIRSVLLNGSQQTEAQRATLLCGLLAAWIVHNDPKANPDPDAARWRSDMRSLLRDRGDDTAEVVRIIDWCQTDSFWRCNVLSPAKLRKQFTQLALKAAAPTNVTPINGRRETASDWLRDIDGIGGAA